MASFHPLDQFRHMVAGAVQVDLHPGTHAVECGDVLDGSGRSIAQYEGNAGIRSGTRQVQVAVARQQTVEAGGPDHERQLRGAAEEAALQAALTDVTQGARLQGHALEDRAIAPQCEFIVRPAFDVLEGEVGQAAAGHLAQLFDVLRTTKIAPRIKASFHSLVSVLANDGRPLTALLSGSA